MRITVLLTDTSCFKQNKSIQSYSALYNVLWGNIKKVQDIVPMFIELIMSVEKILTQL